MITAETDILERLRESHRWLAGINARTTASIYSESAEEIERLRAELATR